ncbi:MAG: hypothetical protein V1904_01910 [Bacteroidota bacterium]
MPKQIIRLLIAFVIFVGLFMLARHFLVPDSFGDLGHYRSDAVDDIKQQEPKYVNSLSCIYCHKDLDSVNSAGDHAGINCQTCHGPGNKHAEDPSANILPKPSGREFCGNCHDINAARPAFIKQVDISKHNTGSKCITCHNPHSPGFKQDVTETSDTAGISGDVKKIDDATCSKCHNPIYIKKISGVHKINSCLSCHGLGDKHVDNPAANVLTKPKGRDFCGYCHGKGTDTSGTTKKIDLQEHNVDGDCIDCHDPHSPLDF